MNTKNGHAKTGQANVLNPPRRASLAWRHATEIDIEAFYYSQTLNRWKRLHDLSRRGNRILRALCALHRASLAGFSGTVCCQEALAKFVERVTEEPCSIRTLQRGLAELIQTGYLARGRPRGRIRVCTYTLTEKATSIWSQDSLHTPKRRTMDRTKTERKSHPQNEIFSQTLSNSGSRSIPDSDLEVDDKEKTKPGTHNGNTSGAFEVPSARSAAGTPRKPKTVADSLIQFLRRLAKKKGRKGRVAVGRAVLELVKDPRALAGPSGVDWSYWLARWASMTHKERQHAAQTEILVLLLGPPGETQIHSYLQPEPRQASLKLPGSPQLQPSKENLARSLRSLEKSFGWNSKQTAAWAAELGIENCPKDREILHSEISCRTRLPAQP